MTDLSTSDVIRSDRWKAGKLLLIGVGFVVLCAVELIKGLGPFALTVCGLLFFGGLTILALANFLVPPELHLEEDGLSLTGFRPWRIAWADVARFRVQRLRRTSMVVIEYRTDRPPGRRFGRSARPRAIPTLLWMRPEELQELLQARLDRARSADPSMPLPPDAEAPSAAAVVTSWPWLSLAMIGVLAIVFAAENLAPLTLPSAPLTPSVATLAGFGGLGRGLLSSPGQWYRFATAPFLHGSLRHLLGNCFALFLAGRLLEGVLGRGWFAAIYVVGALAGGCGSLLLNPANTVGVGASGAIVALFAAAVACSFHFPRFDGRQRLQTAAITILLPTLLTFGRTAGGLTIDFGAHLGGALGGLAVGGLILALWRRPTPMPPHKRLATGIGLAGALAAAAAVWPVTAGRGLYAQATRLVPDAEMPADDAAVIRQAPQLLAWYPDDPRLRLASAYAAVNKGDGDDAEAEARRGLKDMDGVRMLVQPSVEAGLWLALGESYMQRGANADADAAFNKSATYAALAALPFDQAKLHLGMGRLDDALREATRMTELRPRTPAVWNLLGDVRFARGDLQDALKAYGRDADLSASTGPVRMQGLIRFYAGDGDGALVDLRRAAGEEPANLYGALWLDIVAERRGLGSTLADKVLEDGQPWPAPIVRLFAGSLTPEELGREAAAADPQVRKGQVCEAGFYVAERNLVQGRRPEAEDGFKTAAAECPPSFVETWMAKAELDGGAADAR